jgi:hypothetical protein
MGFIAAPKRMIEGGEPALIFFDQGPKEWDRVARAGSGEPLPRGFGGQAARRRRPPIGRNGERFAAREMVSAEFAKSFPGVEIRVPQGSGFGLQIWMSRGDFVSMAFPDRQTFLEAVGKRWCAWIDPWTLRSIVVSDMRTGKDPAVYGCLLSSPRIIDNSN